MKFCETCKHSKMRRGQESTLTLVCAYELPNVLAQIVPTQNGPAPVILTYWPSVEKTDGCRKHEAQLQS
jgi:hypothetical protein